MKKALITIIILVVLAIAAYLLFGMKGNGPAEGPEQALATPSVTPSAPAEDEASATSTILGQSVQGNAINAYHYGSGEKEVMFIGGIHGGYEWNTVLLAYQMMDHFNANPGAIPSDMRVTIVPVMNPDGLTKTVGSTGRFEVSAVPSILEQTVSGRFNANNVDLGRNFDCEWQASAKWQNRTVSGGSAAFSEPESRAIRDYVNSANPAAITTWYSAAGGVFASDCGRGTPSETNVITKTYADAAGYPAYDEYDFYAITGDMVNWFAKQGIPAISVLLTDHTNTEFAKNRAGAEAILNFYSN